MLLHSAQEKRKENENEDCSYPPEEYFSDYWVGANRKLLGKDTYIHTYIKFSDENNLTAFTITNIVRFTKNIYIL